MGAWLVWLSSDMTPILGWLVFVLHLVVIARAITRPNREPASRVAWVAVITFLPLIGMIAYLCLGETSIGRTRIHNLHKVEASMPLPNDAGSAPDAISVQAKPLFDLAQSINGFRPVAGNRIVLLGDPAAPPSEPKADSNASIEVLIADIEQARDHVHIGFYIWLDDHNGGHVTDAVCAAARRGVQCRVMVDALGSRAFVHGPRWKQMQQAGVHVHAMLDDVPRLGHLAIGRVDLRNHRK
ncbi:MAG: PLDc N-terminal domain-containing protein, partial [Xanthomonadaceae bacterium]|nr:PLDc N-terminal domain-containing protein [Xanthomonadaceae bacterium]